jgi:mono/diheme cytochrome c family protein
MTPHRRRVLSIAAVALAVSLCLIGARAAPQAPAPARPAGSAFDASIESHSRTLLAEGRRIFRFDTFGSEAFWGGKVRLHEAILGQGLGGVGPGVSPTTALQLGLKVDAAALPAAVVNGIKEGTISLDAPATTVELLKLNAVVGVTGFFDAGKTKLQSIGIQCALCHSTVDDSFAPGIGQRLDGWPARDLDVGAIVATAPTLKPFADLLGVDEATVRTVLKSWGPGKYDAELNQDGKAMRPDGKPAATLNPAAFGLSGVNLHTYTGWGSVTYWNAYVANTQMYGQGTFFDPRLADASRYPVAAKAGFADKRSSPDLVTSKLAALHYYQLSIPAPRPPAGSFDAAAAARGKAVFEGKAQCARCHVPPLFTEPGWAMHTAQEIGIDDFQAGRSPDRRYRTTPLAGLFTRAKGGFYHDGRFPDLPAVVAHYERVLRLQLGGQERSDLVEYLKSL